MATTYAQYYGGFATVNEIIAGIKADPDLGGKIVKASADAEAVRRQSVRLQGTITSVSELVGGIYTVSLNMGSSTTGTFDGYVAYAHSSEGNYKGGPLTIEDNPSSEGIIWISQAGLVVGDVITVAKAGTSINTSEIVAAINNDATQTTARSNAATAATQAGNAANLAQEAADNSELAAIRALTATTQTTKEAIRTAVEGTWTDEEGNTFDLTIEDTV